MTTETTVKSDVVRIKYLGPVKIIIIGIGPIAPGIEFECSKDQYNAVFRDNKLFKLIK